MKKRFIHRQLKSSLKINPSKLINFKNIFKGLIIILVSSLILSLIIFFSIYGGYESKMISEIENIPEETTTAIVFYDGNTNNFKKYTEIASSAYLNRNVSEVIIINEYDINLKDLIKVNLNKIPESKLVLDTTFYSDICFNNLKDPLKKYILITNPDISIRLSAICNNQGVYMIPYNVINSEYSIDFNKRIEEGIKIVFNSF